MAIDENDIEQFAAAAHGLFIGSQELSNAFPKELGRAKQAADEVTAELAAARLAVKAPNVKKNHENAERALQLLYDRNRALAVRVSKGISPCLENAGAPQDVEIAAGGAQVLTSAAIQAGLNEQLANLRAFDLAIAQFYVATAVTMLDSSVGRCTDTCEAFLGRAVGSHEYKKRGLQIAKA